MPTLATLVFLCAPVAAQTGRFFSFGVIGGAELRPTLAPTSSPQPVACPGACFVHYSDVANKPPVAGASVEFRLPRGLSIEGDLFYQRVGYSSVFEFGSPSTGFTAAFTKTTADRWQLPVIGKYRLSPGRVRPFVLGGAAADWLRHPHTESDFVDRDFFGHILTGHTSYTDVGATTKGPRFGMVLGAGLEARAAWLRVSLQLRFTRWIRARFAAEPDIRSNQSDLAALVTLLF